MNLSKLTAICKSKSEDITLTFSILFDEKEEPIETLGTDWIKEGLTEAFYENQELFEEIDFDSCGGFDLSFELNGEKVEYPFEVDMNGLMQELIKGVE